jgi:NADPH-dependent curcumin reductase CurA
MRVYMGAPPGLAEQFTARSGQVIPAFAIGQVLESRDARFPVGSYVRDQLGKAGVQDYCVLPASSLVAVDPRRARLPAYLGVLGTQGLTAYFGLLKVGRPVEGDTVVVSAAAGATGSAAGQIAKINGCRTVGIAGGPAKCRAALEMFGFDACVDYKSSDWPQQLDAACPKGIDVFFDNVGGETLDACLLRMARHGRIVFCGAVAEYNATSTTGLKNYMQVLNRTLRWEAINYHEHLARLPEATASLQRWLEAGLLKHSEHIVVGLENFYSALMKLFSGENTGKLVLQVSSETPV